MTNDLAAASIGTTTAADWLTPANLVLIAIGVVLALLVIWWGARLKRQRKAIDTAIEDRAEEQQTASLHPEPPLARSLDEMPPPAPETEPAPVAPSPPPLADTPVVAAAPLAGTPVVAAAPLAGTPVVAAAPLDATPATLAADLATPPAEAPSTSDAPSDQLTTLKGVGPKLAARLGELGYTRFAQIAALSPAEADALDAQLGSFQGRMARDRWVEQAGYLARDDRDGFEAAFGKL